MFTPADIKAVIFDYGATLDTGGDHWAYVFLDAWTRAGVPLEFDSFREAYIAGERALARASGSGDTIAPDCTFRRLLGMKTRRQAQALVDTGALSDSACLRLADTVADICLAAARRQTRRSAEILQRLTSRYRLAVVSNFYGNLDAVLDEFGLLPLFDFTIDSTVAGVRKPDPAIFSLACRSLGVPPEATLVAGDSPTKDIAPATALGCRTALIPGRKWPGITSTPCHPDLCGSLEHIAGTLLT